MTIEIDFTIHDPKLKKCLKCGGIRSLRKSGQYSDGKQIWAYRCYYCINQVRRAKAKMNRIRAMWLRSIGL